MSKKITTILNKVKQIKKSENEHLGEETEKTSFSVFGTLQRTPDTEQLEVEQEIPDVDEEVNVVSQAPAKEVIETSAKEEYVIIDQDGKVWSRSNEYTFPRFLDTVDDPDGGYAKALKFTKDVAETKAKSIGGEVKSVKEAFGFVETSAVQEADLMTFCESENDENGTWASIIIEPSNGKITKDNYKQLLEEYGYDEDEISEGIIRFFNYDDNGNIDIAEDHEAGVFITDLTKNNWYKQMIIDGEKDPSQITQPEVYQIIKDNINDYNKMRDLLNENDEFKGDWGDNHIYGKLTEVKFSETSANNDKFEWFMTTGEACGYDTGNHPTLCLDFGFGIVTLQQNPYEQPGEDLWYTEIDFEGGYTDSQSSATPEGALKGLNNYIDSSLPEVSDNFIEELQQY